MLSNFTRFLVAMALAVCTATGQTTWIASQRNGSEARFLFANQVQRYDLNNKAWLSAITLPRSGATAMAADDQGAAVAYGTTIYRYGTGFTNESLVGTTNSSIASLFIDGNLIIAIHSQGLYGRISVFDRNLGTKLSSVETYVDSMYGTSHAPVSNRLYGRTQGISPADIVTSSYTDAGISSDSSDGPYHGNYPNATRTWVFPDETRVVDSSGTVYATPGLTYVGSLAGTVTDIAFNGDVPVVLSGTNLIAFSKNLLEAGRTTVTAATGAALHVSTSDAFVFSPGTGTPSVVVTPLSSINAPVPGTPTQPEGLAYTVDDAFPDKDGNLLLFSKNQMSLFRWSPSTRQYTGSIPLLGVADFAAYSKENHCAYFAYPTQVIRKLDLTEAQPKETPLINLPAAARGFAMAGQYPYVATSPGLNTYSPSGANITIGSFTYYLGSHNTWDPVNRRMYHFRDGISPNDLHYDTINADGQITGGAETPYHGDFSTTKPIRVSPDGSKVVIGSGVVFNASDLTKAANLSNDFVDAVWSGDRLVTLRQISGVSQLQVWEGTQFLPSNTVRQFSGTPLRLFDTAAGLIVITSVEGVPRFTVLDAALETIYISPTKPLAPSALAVTNRTHTSISLQWQDMSDNEDGFRIEYRSNGGAWLDGGSVGAGLTKMTVSNLAAALTYEFRAIATNGSLLSTTSPVISGKTLSSPNEPIGEPYNLKVTRIFNNRILLEWQDNASNETGFGIYRSTNSSSLGTKLSASAGSVSYMDLGLTANTIYYYRIQVVNGAVTGDLSTQISARTLSSATSPSSPSGLTAVVNGSSSIALSWNDNSTNEDEFAIERSTSPAALWAEIGRVKFNETKFTDLSVTPDTGYTYRIRSINAAGSNVSSSVTAKTLKLGGEFAGISTRTGGIHYFVFTGPDRIERYDLNARAWLTAIPLQAAATALWVDECGIFVAEDRAVVRFDSDGENRTPLANGESTVKGLFTIGDTLLFQTGTKHTSLDKLSGILLSTFNYSYTGTGFSVLQSQRRTFFRSTGVSPSDIHYLDIGPDGKMIKGRDSVYHGSYPSATRTFLFPNGARVADDSGTVYSTDSLTYTNSLGSTFTDLDFHGADVPIVLRGNKLHSYSNTLLESGSFTLSTTALRLAISGTDALVFIADGKNSHGLRVQSVPLNDIAAPVPGLPVDPRGLAFTPDEVFVDRNGELFFFSKSHLSLFRWSPQIRDFLPSLPLVGSPRHAAYSKINHTAYFAYETQVVREMDLSADNPAEIPLFTMSAAPRGLATAGEFIFADDDSGAWDSHYVFSPTGEQLQAVEWNRYSRVYEWDPMKRRMYFFRDDTSPNDLHFETISTSGIITGSGETPYHGDFTVAPPIRINADGTRIVIGSGAVFETNGMTRITALPNTITDAVWRNDDLLTIRASGSNTQIQRWNASTLLPGAAVPVVSGTPLRLLALNGRDLALVTIENGVPSIRLLNEDLTVAYTYIPKTSNPPSAVEDAPFVWNPKWVGTGLGSGPLTVTAHELPSWLSFANGLFTGTPRDPDSGGQVTRSKNHRLVIRATNGLGQFEDKEFTVTVAWRNDLPKLPTNPEPIRSNDKADDAIVDLMDILTDPDAEDVHVWEMTGISNPAIFSNVELDSGGLLNISYTPYVSGSSEIDIEVTDASGKSSRTTIRIILPDLPAPKVTVDPSMTFNRSNGLYEQKVTVKNIAARAVAGFDLTISGLRSGVSLYNATTAMPGAGFIGYRKPIEAGKSVVFTLKYYATRRGAIPQPVIKANLFYPSAIAKRKVAPPGSTGGAIANALALVGGTNATIEEPSIATPPAGQFAIDRIHRDSAGSVTIEFGTETGKSYRMQYSADTRNWKTCPEIFVGTGKRVQWIDHGPPSTDSPPTSTSSRFYRVERTDD